MFLLIFFLFLAIFVSFLCSILEAVLLSITPSYIESLEQKDGGLGHKLKRLKEDVDRPLSAILSLNTIAHTVGAAGVGVQAAKVFGEEYMGWVSAILTFLILVISEIIPKTLGVNYWRALSGFTAYTLNFLIIILYPLVLMAQGLTKLLSKGEKQPLISRSEIYAMADMGHKEGIFLESESRILKNLVRLKSLKVDDIMTPRTVVVAASENMSLKKLYEDKGYLRFSRIPIYENSIDNVSGYVHKHDILDKLAKDAHKIPLKDIKRDILMVSETMPITTLFEKLIAEREQFALALDGYGGMAGVVSMEDVLETLLGLEIVDEYDNTKDMQEYARTRWKERAKVLGIITEDKQPVKSAEAEKEKIIKSGITGSSPTVSSEKSTDKDNKKRD